MLTSLIQILATPTTSSVPIDPDNCTVEIRCKKISSSDPIQHYLIASFAKGKPVRIIQPPKNPGKPHTETIWGKNNTYTFYRYPNRLQAMFAPTRGSDFDANKKLAVIAQIVLGRGNSILPKGRTIDQSKNTFANLKDKYDLYVELDHADPTNPPLVSTARMENLEAKHFLQSEGTRTIAQLGTIPKVVNHRIQDKWSLAEDRTDEEWQYSLVRVRPYEPSDRNTTPVLTQGTFDGDSYYGCFGSDFTSSDLPTHLNGKLPSTPEDWDKIVEILYKDF